MSMKHASIAFDLETRQQTGIAFLHMRNQAGPGNAHTCQRIAISYLSPCTSGQIRSFALETATLKRQHTNSERNIRNQEFDMPLIKIQVAGTLADEKKRTILTTASRIVAEATGKPETYVMALLEDDAVASLAGTVCPAAFADIRGIGGLNGTVNTRISAEICALLQQEAGIEPDKVYLTFTDVPARNWGWNSSTFG